MMLQVVFQARFVLAGRVQNLPQRHDSRIDGDVLIGVIW